jgi:hypothetical protein
MSLSVRGGDALRGTHACGQSNTQAMTARRSEYRRWLLGIGEKIATFILGRQDKKTEPSGHKNPCRLP